MAGKQSKIVENPNLGLISIVCQPLMNLRLNLERSQISQTRIVFGTLGHFGSSSKHAEIGPESFGIVVCRFVGTVPDIWGLAWPSLTPKSCSKSKTSGRILQICRGPLSSAASSGSRPEWFRRGPGGPQYMAVLWEGIVNLFRDRKSVILGVWAAPGASETLPKGVGLRPPPFARVSGAPGAAQTPKMTDLRFLFVL